MTAICSNDEYILKALQLATQQLGFDVQEAVIGLGLPPDLLNTPEQFVPSQLFNCLLESIARDFHCYDIALVAAQHLRTPQLGLPARVMELSPHLRAALPKATQYGAFYRDTGPWQHHISDGQVALYKNELEFGHELVQQRNLLGTAQMLMLMTQLCGETWRPSKVSLSMPDPGARFSQSFTEFFGCEIDYDQHFDALHFSEAYLDLPIATANTDLLLDIELHIHKLQRDILKEGDFITRVKLVINQRLNFGSCSKLELAKYLGTSIEHLTAELQAAQLDFETLLEQQISEKANYYLTEFHAPTKLILSTLMPNNERRLNQLLSEKINAVHQW